MAFCGMDLFVSNMGKTEDVEFDIQFLILPSGSNVWIACRTGRLKNDYQIKCHFASAPAPAKNDCICGTVNYWDIYLCDGIAGPAVRLNAQVEMNIFRSRNKNQGSL